MQIIGSHHSSTGSETRVGPSNLCFNKPSSRVRCRLMFEDELKWLSQMYLYIALFHKAISPPLVLFQTILALLEHLFFQMHIKIMSSNQTKKKKEKRNKKFVIPMKSCNKLYRNVGIIGIFVIVYIWEHKMSFHLSKIRFHCFTFMNILFLAKFIHKYYSLKSQYWVKYFSHFHF